MAVSVAPWDGEKVERFAALHENPPPRARFGERGCVLNAVFESSAHAVKEFTVREDDVWVVTAPKSGTTWTQEMVWLLLHDFDYETAKEEKLQKRCPFLEHMSLHGKTTFEDLDDHPSPRCIKTHLHKDLLPDQLWTKKPKIVYVAREPKDVALSAFHHEVLLQSYKGDKELFFECFYEDSVGFCPLWEHVLDFWRMKDDPNVLFYTFEEMKKDLPAIIRRTAQFLAKEVTDEQVTRLAAYLDIEQMKQNPAVNMEESLAKKREQGLITGEQAFIRKGLVGEGRREMTSEMAALFDERTRRVFSDAVGGCPWQI